MSSPSELFFRVLLSIEKNYHNKYNKRQKEEEEKQMHICIRRVVYAQRHVRVLSFFILSVVINAAWIRSLNVY